jgi:hypothetical protein
VPVGAFAASDGLPVPEASGEEVRRLAREVLADPAFDRAQPGLLVRARDWFFEQLGELLGRLVAAAGDGPLAWVVVAVVVAGALVMVVRLTRDVHREPRSATGPLSGPRRPPADWLAEASRLEAAGDWRAGLRCRHRALVASLAGRGLVTEVPGRTAGEYRLAVATAAPAAADAFAGATSLFEVAWYGHGEVGAEDVRRFTDLADQVLAGVGGPR